MPQTVDTMCNLTETFPVSMSHYAPLPNQTPLSTPYLHKKPRPKTRTPKERNAQLVPPTLRTFTTNIAVKFVHVKFINVGLKKVGLGP